MMQCFRLPNKGRDSEDEKSSPAREGFRFAKGRSEEESFMMKNGGLTLEGLISSCSLNFTPYRTFSKRQLQIESNNFTRNGVVNGYYYRWYKLNLDDREVIVKTWKLPESSSNIQFSIAEIVVGLQMNNHKNALKLLGCCLETPTPTLVQEFAENGRLSDHIYEVVERPLLPWESRLRIAIEVAHSISYLHIGSYRPIIHRNICTRNIFLDKHFVAKLSEFGASVSIPLGETYVAPDELMGTKCYTDPMYLLTGKCTEKSDVYSFAVVLFEISSGKSIFDCMSDYGRDVFDDMFDDVSPSSVYDSPDFIGPKNDIELLVESGKNILEVEDHIWRYFTANILKEGNKEQIMACAGLARRCMAINPEERPTIVEVVYEFRRIKSIRSTSS